MRIGLCDDEPLVLQNLSRLVKECMEELGMIGKLGMFHSAVELLEEEHFAELELLFLDLAMPKMDGIEAGRQLRRLGSDCKIIVSTNMEERYKEAFQIQAFRFVTKPFQKAEIKEVLRAAWQEGAGSEEIELYEQRNLHTMRQKEIAYARSVNGAVECFAGKRVFRKEISLKELEQMLDQRLFYRISKQYLVNMGKIGRYCEGKVLIQGKELKVAVRRRKEFEKAYVEFELNHG